MAEPEERLLPRRSSDSTGDSDYYRNEKYTETAPQSNRNSLLITLIACLFISLVGNIGLAFGWRDSQSLVGRDQTVKQTRLQYPAREVLEYQQVVFDSAIGEGVTPYQGSPTNESEALWDNLYKPLMGRISHSEAENMPNRTASDGNGYIVILNVFHDLHCLHTVRKALYYFVDDDWNSTYNPYSLHGSGAGALRNWGTGTHDPHDFDMWHLDHCIDALRQSTMCNGDITPNVWQYSPKVKQVRPRSTVLHECRNFQKIKQWGVEHGADGFKGFSDSDPEAGLCGVDYPETCESPDL